MFRSPMGSSSGNQIKETLHKDKLATRVHFTKIQKSQTVKTWTFVYSTVVHFMQFYFSVIPR
jgi:hypothetical protein